MPEKESIVWLVNLLKKLIFCIRLKLNRKLSSELEKLGMLYVSSLDLSGKKTKQHYFIGLVGSYGVGKTTVAKKISERLPFIVISSDEGRRLAEQNGFSHKIIEKQQLLFFVGLKVIKELLAKGINIILDADLMEPQYRMALSKILKSSGYTFILLRVIAQEDEVQKRIRNRAASEPSQYLKLNLPRHCEERKKIHSQNQLPKNIFYTLTNDESLKEQIENLIKKLLTNFKFEEVENVLAKKK